MAILAKILPTKLTQRPIDFNVWHQKFYYWFLSINAVVAILVILFYAPQTFFGLDSETDHLKWAWVFQRNTYKSLNFLNLIRFLVLGFVTIFTLVKNYHNIFAQKELVRKYKWWFLIYYALTLSSLVLLVIFQPIYNDLFVNQQTKSVAVISGQQVLLVSLILVPLWIVNSGYQIYMYHFKKRTEPLNYNSVWVVVISVISQLILLAVAIGLIVGFTPNKPAQYDDKGEITQASEYILDENPLYKFFSNLFQNSTVTNLVIIFFMLLAFGIVILGANINKILFLINKQSKSAYFQNQFRLLLLIIFPTLVWLLVTTIRFGKKLTIFAINNFSPLILGIDLAICLGLLMIFGLIQLRWKNFRIQPNWKLSLVVMFSIFITITTLLAKNNTFNYQTINWVMMIFVFSIFGLLMFLIKDYQNYCKLALILLVFNAILLTALMVFQGLNVLLVYVDNQVLVTISGSSFNLIDIFLILVLVNSLLVLLVHHTNLLMIATKIKVVVPMHSSIS